VIGEIQIEVRVVVIHQVEQSCESTIVVETALLVRPKPCQRRGTVHMRRRPVGLERVDAYLRRRMMISVPLAIRAATVAPVKIKLRILCSLVVGRRRETVLGGASKFPMGRRIVQSMSGQSSLGPALNGCSAMRTAVNSREVHTWYSPGQYRAGRKAAVGGEADLPGRWRISR
jgi:hypothetical protein